ncbi:hydroxymethylbilane synthase [Streptomyces sp. ET3-23]|uniref:hydroxymethylbilane synthase n=1 Tax=Streptomyces sp. ET3-23 TaxID=2885643 RepID=UPI001D1160B3|nr:hydroxymethylbilane synthase [Streptomyces sp. ET3-23]MCC2280551.1 hydroxymethylbilane synthase [Streptomyces sp. ET3-23]
MTVITVGSRASHLARAQVAECLSPLRRRFPHVVFRHRVVAESADRDRRTALAEVSRAAGGAAFAGAQEAALLAKEVDVVVHSFKDLPAAPTPGLVLLAPPSREDVRDALCGSTLGDLPEGARVGTSAPRRIAQLLAARPDLCLVPIRGNVPPRLAKARTGGLDAVVLAAAGLRRLGRAEEITDLLPVDPFTPSPAQGALGIQIREDDAMLRDLLTGLGDHETDAQVRAERAVLTALRCGCDLPLGAYARTRSDGSLSLTARVTALDGTREIAVTATGPTTDPETLGRAVADDLLRHGAGPLLDAARAVTG